VIRVTAGAIGDASLRFNSTGSRRSHRTGAAAMTAIAARKSRDRNLLEGTTLIAIFQAVPNFAAAVLLLKLVGGDDMVGDPGGATIFVALAALFYALAIPLIASKFPKLAASSHEPLFFDTSMSFPEKLLCWRTSPNASLRLLTTVMLLSVLAVAVVSMG
jgi:hypothetical protein